MTRTVLGTVVLAVTSLLPAALAQGTAAPAANPSGCGDAAIRFDVDTDKGLHPAPREAGKALVYFIEDDSNVSGLLKPTTRVGLDGKWMGATHGNSYFFFLVDPGVHHLCASWQPVSLFARGQTTAALDFTAKAGGTYYFQASNSFKGSSRPSTVALAPLTAGDGFDTIDGGYYAYSIYKLRP